MGSDFLIKDSEPYKLLLKHSLSYIFVVNKKAELIDTNEKAIRELEYDKGEILGTPISNYISEKSLPTILEKLQIRFKLVILVVANV